MARIITTVGSGAAAAALTEAQVLALIRQNVGYEYIKTVKLTTSEVAAIQVTGLDTSVYSGFRIVSTRLGYGGGSSTSITWTLRVITGTSTVDSASNYEYQGIKLSSATGVYASSQTAWTTTFGYGLSPSNANFTLDYNVTPSSSIDANIWLEVGDSKQGGYWPASGILTGIHSAVTGASPTGIEIASNQNFRAIQDTAYITVMGLRIKS